MVNKVSNEQAKDTGIILTLICLFVGYTTQSIYLNIASLVILALALVACTLFKPLAKALFFTSHVLARFTSPIILFVIYLVLILPVGIFRQFMQFDSLSLNRWKKDDLSVFKIRDHSYEPKDLDDPY